jgi:hypothetical protein
MAQPKEGTAAPEQCAVQKEKKERIRSIAGRLIDDEDPCPD